MKKFSNNKKLNLRGKIFIFLVFILTIFIIYKIINKGKITTVSDEKHLIEYSPNYSIKIDFPEFSNEILKEKAKEWIKNKEEEFRKTLNSTDEIQYDLLINYEQSTYNNVQYTHIISYMYTGENHYLREDKSFYFDLNRKNEVTIVDFLKNEKCLEQISNLAYSEILKEKEKQQLELNQDWIKNGTEAILDNYNNFQFDDNGLHILFLPYQVGPWSDGEIEILITYDKINEIINFVPQEKIHTNKVNLSPKDRNLDSFKNKKVIAITFDDGPSIYTEQLLNTLKKEDWKVSFFVLGSRVKEYPDIVKKMYEDGHEIGSHTYNHLNLKNLSKNEVSNEISKTNKIIEETIGKTPEFIRPPYGNTNDTIKAIGNMITILWSVDTEDWKSKNADSVYSEIIKNSKDGSIILLHDLYKTSIDGALRAMKELQKEGYEFLTINEMFKLKNIEKNIQINYYSFK